MVPSFQEIVIHHHQVEGDVLPLAARVGETDIDVFDFLFLDELVDVGCGRLLVGHDSVFPSIVIGHPSRQLVAQIVWCPAYANAPS
jgi:hypothetical protein